MNPEVIPYPRGKHLTIAGCLALLALLTAVIYACRSTPYTMVLFLGGGSALLFAAILLFGWTVWKDLRARLESMATKEFAPGQVIFRQGDPAEQVYVITKGQVEAVYADPAKGDVIIGRLGRDEYFGETAILSRLPRQVTVRAIDAVELLVIHRTDFLRLYASLPRLRARIEAQHAKRKALMNQVGSSN
jgi:signal-transduction protein with cAMP-binding, CBS, and nucleotidyltransferase domain